MEYTASILIAVIL